MPGLRAPHLVSAWSAITAVWEGKEFHRYLHRRGYPSGTGWGFFRRAFLECWAQPGFHWFWRVWNPGLGFLVFRLYHALGGKRGDPVTKVLAFLASGIAHNLLVLPFLGWSFTLPVAFAAFGVLVAAGPRSSRILRQHRWPRPLNIPLNVALVLACFTLGFRVDEAIRCGCG